MNEKVAYEEFKTLRSNVKSETLKELVKELRYAIFGIFDKDDKDDDKDDKDDKDDDKDDRDDNYLDKFLIFNKDDKGDDKMMMMMMVMMMMMMIIAPMAEKRGITKKVLERG